MRRYLRLLALYFEINVQNDAAYRFDFLMKLVLAILSLIGELFTLWVIFANAKSLAGWSAYDAVVLLGVFRIMVALISMVIAPSMRATMEDVRKGTLDFLLLKPMNAQFAASFRQIVIWRLADAILGLALVIGGVALGNSHFSVAAAGQFVITLTAGAIIIYSFWLILATTVFWFTRIANIEMVFWNVFHAGRYPIDVYRPWVRWTLTFILPMAFLTTFPAGALVGRNPPTALWAAVIVAPAMFIAATAFWRFGVRRYSGASA